MTKLERLTGVMILLGFVCTLDIMLFDHVGKHVSAVIATMTKALTLGR